MHVGYGTVSRPGQQLRFYTILPSFILTILSA
jgi:hypothetical protein